MRPKRAPLLKACSAFAGLSFSSPRLTVTCPRVMGSSISGIRNFDMAIDAGMDITEAVTRFSGGTPRLIYALSTEPAMVENPRDRSARVIRACWRERVWRGLTGSHGEVELGLSHVVDVRADETRRLALADERRCRSNDSLSTGDVHDLEEEPRAVRISVSARQP